jgi:hypothetical protein
LSILAFFTRKMSLLNTNTFLNSFEVWSFIKKQGWLWIDLPGNENKKIKKIFQNITSVSYWTKLDYFGKKMTPKCSLICLCNAMRPW